MKIKNKKITDVILSLYYKKRGFLHGMELSMLICVFFLFLGTAVNHAAELKVGTAMIDLTPDKRIALRGQLYTRISKGVDSPITASALALESVADGKPQDQAILISADIISVGENVLDATRKKLSKMLPEFDVSKLVITATHTHTSGAYSEGRFDIPDEDDVMKPLEFAEFISERMAKLSVQAWKKRANAKVAWGLGHAVVGWNRRAVYTDGTHQMYGKTNIDKFRGIEGGEDHAIEMLYFWDAEDRPISACVNIACPSQVDEHNFTIGADFWEHIREDLGATLDGNYTVLGWPSAAGDLSPRDLYRIDAQARMLKLRGISKTRDLANRIVPQVKEVESLVQNDKHQDVAFRHIVKKLDLPVRMVTEKEVAAAKKEIARLQKKGGDVSTLINRQKLILNRFNNQEEHNTYPTEIHVIRIGDIVIATNQFELFQAFGEQIKARSKALQTFVVQLTGPGTYLPTQFALDGGGYSAVVQSNRVGPEGGQVLVEETLKIINSLF